MDSLTNKSTNSGCVSNGNNVNSKKSISNTAATIIQGITRYFSPVSAPDRQQTASRPTESVASNRSSNVSDLQGGMSESEALARAMAESIQQQPVTQSSCSRSNQHGEDVEDEDAMLARAIAT